MDYTQAVILAREGKEDGFQFLYENTYRSKYYLALKYMKDEEAAKDVLQEAYIKAFAKLDTLERPEAFSGWLGTIVANTAKNTLEKKSPLLFSDIAVNDENETFEYQIEDENTQNQPETAYTKQETQELVHELIDSLSDEQRMCILMFHIEGESISEIAAAMNCSENTVKSRLNYGRKNLRVKAEELQKKGYKLYGIAPILLLIYLLGSEEKIMAAEGLLDTAGSLMAEQIFSSAPTAAPTVMPPAGMSDAAKISVKTAAKNGFLHTVAGKITAVVLGVCIVGGVTAATYNLLNSGKQVFESTSSSEQTDASTIQLPTNTSEDMDESVAETTSQEAEDAFAPVTDDQYASLLQGNLTKEQFCFVLAAGPKELSEQGMSDTEQTKLMNFMAMSYDSLGIQQYSFDGNRAAAVISTADANRILSVITDYQYTEDTSPQTVQGDHLTVITAGGVNVSVRILSAEAKNDEMRVVYEHTEEKFGLDPNVIEKRIAILKPQENRLYRITQIQPYQEETSVPSAPASTQDWKSAYEKVLQDAPNQSYSTKDGLVVAQPYVTYMLSDLDGDFIPELILTASSGVDGENTLSIRCLWIGIYSCTNSAQAQLLDNFCYNLPAFSQDTNSNQLIVASINSFKGEATYFSIKLENGSLVEEQLNNGQPIPAQNTQTYQDAHGFVKLENSVVSDLALLQNS